MNHGVNRSALGPACFCCCQGANRARTLGHCLVGEMDAQVGDAVDCDSAVVFAFVLASFLCLIAPPHRTPILDLDLFCRVELASVGPKVTCSCWWCARWGWYWVDVDVDVDLGGCYGCDCGWWQTSLELFLFRRIPPQISEVCVEESGNTFG